ncbi:MAG: phosphotransferase, partial [Micromonosporaceae bacterium]
RGQAQGGESGGARGQDGKGGGVSSPAGEGGAGAEVAAIDFGDGGLGDPVWDLVVLTHWDAERLPAVLAGYRPDPATRDRLRQLYRPYQISRHLLAVEWLTDHGYDPAPTLDELTRIASQRDISRSAGTDG